MNKEKENEACKTQKIIPRGITEYIVKKKKAKRENIIKEAQKDK